MDIKEGNKLIVEFMGWTIEKGMENEDDPYFNQPYKPGFMPNMILLSRLQFHSSWDWLMPVGKKCYDIWIPNWEKDMECKEIFEEVWSGLWHFDIQQTWEEVVNFIQWYNNKQSDVLHNRTALAPLRG